MDEIATTTVAIMRELHRLEATQPRLDDLLFHTRYLGELVGHDDWSKRLTYKGGNIPTMIKILTAIQADAYDVYVDGLSTRHDALCERLEWFQTHINTFAFDHGLQR